jgi:ribonuclease Z
MTFKVTVLGNGAAMPTAGKHHSAHALNVHEQYYLVDCGEGTQTRLVECGINPLKINAIFITHLHGDHLYGLFPLIATLSLMGRKTPLAVYAPAPLGELMEAMDRLLGEREGFAVEFHPVDTRQSAMIWQNKVMEVWTIPLRHRVPAAGYLFREKTPALNVRKEMVGRYGLSVGQIVAAKRGEAVTLDDGNPARADAPYSDVLAGAVIPNSALTYTPYQPRAYAYCSDTLYSPKVARLVEGVDLLYHEATFAAEDKALATQTGHSTAAQAATVALKAGVGRLLIGHFSGRYRDLGCLVEQARAIFPATDAAIEGQTYEIKPKK